MYIKQTGNVIILANASCPTGSNMPKSGAPFQISYLNMIPMCCVIPMLLYCCAFCYRIALQELNFSDAPHALVVQRWLSRCQPGLAACLRASFQWLTSATWGLGSLLFHGDRQALPEGYLEQLRQLPLYEKWCLWCKAGCSGWCGCHIVFFL